MINMKGEIWFYLKIETMKKTVTFTEKDKVLIERLEAYKTEKGYKSIIAVVRDLCDDALH